MAHGGSSRLAVLRCATRAWQRGTPVRISRSPASFNPQSAITGLPTALRLWTADCGGGIAGQGEEGSSRKYLREGKRGVILGTLKKTRGEYAL